MKFTPEVIAALQVLKDNAENDFERHRISVLEQDLTEPPKVEIIDEKHQKFDGLVYHKNAKGHFQATRQIHRDLYYYSFGKIPEGFEIHHQNFIKSDNDINNLSCLLKSDHIKLHGNPILEKVCINCGKKFTTKRVKAKFCSISCASKMQFKGQSEERECPVCGKIFHTTISKNKICCSRKCAGEYHHQRNKKFCPVCGKEMRKGAGGKTCSVKCGIELTKQNRRSKKSNTR